MSSNTAERFVFGRPVDPVHAVAIAEPRPGTMLMGRAMIAAIFLLSGANKLLNIEKTIAYMTSEGIPYASTLAYVAAGAEIAGAASILFGLLTRLGAIGLILFMIPATLIFHDFWTFTGQEQQMQLINFMKNLAIIGGLSLLVAIGAGRYSIDARLREPKPA